MKGLRGLLIRKMVITGIFWCIPLLSFPSAWLIAGGIPDPEPVIFIRLLGVAYLALLVGYYGALQGIRTGANPLPVIHMGLMSNGGAGLVLGYFGVTGAWSAWGTVAQVFLWLSMVGALAITFSLMKFRARFITGLNEGNKSSVNR